MKITIKTLKGKNMKALMEKSVNIAMNCTQYNLRFKQLVEEGRTTGEQTEERIDYTKSIY